MAIQILSGCFYRPTYTETTPNNTKAAIQWGQSKETHLTVSECVAICTTKPITGHFYDRLVNTGMCHHCMCGYLQCFGISCHMAGHSSWPICAVKDLTHQFVSKVSMKLPCLCCLSTGQNSKDIYRFTGSLMMETAKMCRYWHTSQCWPLSCRYTAASVFRKTGKGYTTQFSIHYTHAPISQFQELVLDITRL